MSNKDRKCAKCFVQASENITLHRFPQPGRNNNERVQSWAIFCYPNEDWTSVASLHKLFKKHIMLCSNHFSNEYFFMESTTGKRRINKYAIPSDTNIPLRPGPSSTRECVLGNESNTQLQNETTLQAIEESSTADNSNAILGKSESTSQSENVAVMQETASNSKTLLNNIGVHKLTELSPRKQKLYVRCRKNLSEIARLRTKVKNMKTKHKRSALLQELVANANCNKMLEKKITGPFALMLQSQLINTTRKLHGRRWRTDDKIMALGIYKKSAACYRLLRRLFCLPSPNTLKGLLNKVSLHCGINSKIFDTIKEITEKRENEENLCMIAFDEMSIRKNLNYNSKRDEIEGYQDHGVKQGKSKEVASHALVFMAIGLRKKWKQPLAYYFSGDSVTADRLKVLIKEVLEESFRVGLIVLGTVCDLDGGNIKALNLLGSTTEKPFFKFNDHELVTILDPPHLLKCFRNMFLKYDIECNENIQVEGRFVKGVAKWSHIKGFFDIDNANRNFVFAPALTKQHIEPNGKQKMKVRLAAQVLSHTVASGLYCKISTNELPRGATATAMVVNKIDQLFDALNADSPDYKNGKPFLTNLTDRSPHKKYFQEMKQFFSEIKFLGCRTKPPSQDGWIRTMNGVLQLQQNLKKMDISSFPTKRINQDPLENCFGCIRNNCGCNPNPNTVQFVAALKTSILNNLINTGNKRNCENDSNIILHDLKSFVCMKNDRNIIEESIATTDNIENIPEPCIHSSLTADVQACTYVSGYIFKRLATDCDLCKSAMLIDNANEKHLFIQFKEYRDDKESLCYVTNDFIEAVQHCANIANSFLKINSISHDLKKNLHAKLASANFAWLAICQTHYSINVKHIINCVLSICIKRYCVIENRKFVEEASRKALKRKMSIIRHT